MKSSSSPARRAARICNPSDPAAPADPAAAAASAFAAAAAFSSASAASSEVNQAALQTRSRSQPRLQPLSGPAEAGGRLPANQPLPPRALREAVNPRSPDHLLKEQILQDFLGRLGLYLRPLDLALPRIRSLSGDFQNTPNWLYHLSEIIFAKKAGGAAEEENGARSAAKIEAECAAGITAGEESSPAGAGEGAGVQASGVQLPFQPQLMYLGPLILRLNFRQDRYLNLGEAAGGDWLYFQLGHVMGMLLFDHHLNIEQLLALQQQSVAAKYISGTFCRELLSTLFERRTALLYALAGHPASRGDPYLSQLLSQAARTFYLHTDLLRIKEELDKIRGYLLVRARHELGGDCYQQAANHGTLPWDLFETIDCSGCRSFNRRHYLALQLLNLLLLFDLLSLQHSLAVQPYQLHVPLLHLAAALRACALLQLPRCERFTSAVIRLSGPDPSGIILPKLVHRCHLKPLLDYYDLQTLMQRFDLQILRLPSGKVLPANP